MDLFSVEGMDTVEAYMDTIRITCYQGIMIGRYNKCVINVA